MGWAAVALSVGSEGPAPEIPLIRHSLEIEEHRADECVRRTGPGWRGV